MRYKLKHHVLKNRCYSSRQGGFVEEVKDADIEVSIDIDQIVRQIANQAIQNTTGRARLLSGLIQAKVTNRYPREPIFTPWEAK
jgi:hypothetical protein